MVPDAAGDRRRKHPEPPRRLRRRRAGRALAVRDRPPTRPPTSSPCGSPPWSRCAGLELGEVDGSIVSSVVPQLTPEYAAMCERYLDGRVPDRRPGAQAPGWRSGSTTRASSGADRLVNAVAAYQRFGGPCAVVDFGTAITFDVVSAEGEYLGGVIGPGVEISMEALAAAGREAAADRARRAAGRARRGDRQVDPREPPVGIVYGFAGAVDAIARRVQRELGDETRSSPPEVMPPRSCRSAR